MGWERRLLCGVPTPARGHPGLPCRRVLPAGVGSRERSGAGALRRCRCCPAAALGTSRSPKEPLTNGNSPRLLLVKTFVMSKLFSLFLRV